MDDGRPGTLAKKLHDSYMNLSIFAYNNNNNNKVGGGGSKKRRKKRRVIMTSFVFV